MLTSGQSTSPGCGGWKRSVAVIWHELRSNQANFQIADPFSRKCYRTARSKFRVSNSPWLYFS
jgi:hypothetical protein